MNKVYITATGSYLPGEAIPNESIEDYLGKIGGIPSTTRKHVLKQNGIRSRHYALNSKGIKTHNNYEMAAKAILNAVDKSPLQTSDIEYLACATTLNDAFVPGFSSLVQNEGKINTCDIASFSGVCASGMAALKSAFAMIKSGEYSSSAVSGSEFASRYLKAERYEELDSWKTKKEIPIDADFLRWMLSDGAGAFILQDHIPDQGLALKIDWIDQRSHADKMDVCMYAGAQKNDNEEIQSYYTDAPDFQQAIREGHFILRQDLNLMEKIIPLGVHHYLHLINSGKLQNDFDWCLCHYSSHRFKKSINELLEKSNAAIPEDKWFTNLYEKGNMGSASIFIMLDDLVTSEKLKEGQRIVCHVPESGRFITSFMHVTVEQLPSQTQNKTKGKQRINVPNQLKNESPKQKLMRNLLMTWLEFDKELQTVPIIHKLENGNFTKTDYKKLLLNLRQQVMEGSRWISRAASNIPVENFELRSMYIKHSHNEHKDFKMLENNYVSLGGKQEDILHYPKNIGSEIFSAYMFHEASQHNPLHLVGSVFIIEGLGNNLAARWGKLICQKLTLKEDQVSFLLYHGANDKSHINELEEAIDLLPLTEDLINKIIKTAKITSRLYRLQLEELGNW